MTFHPSIIGFTVRFVLGRDSHDKTAKGSAWFLRSHAPVASDYKIDLRFSIRKEVRFQSEDSYKSDNFIWNENRNGLIYGEKHDFVRV